MGELKAGWQTMGCLAFTVEEENLICAFDTSDRLTLIAAITNAIPELDEPELCEIAQNVRNKLETISDAEFPLLEFSPAYDGDETEV